MRVTSLVPCLLGFSSLTSASRSFRRDVSGNETAEESSVAPKRFIVEIDQTASRGDLIQHIESKSGSRVVKVFDSAIFSGIAIESDSLNTDALQSIQSVVRAWHSTRINLSPVVQGSSFSDDAAAPKYFIHDMTGVDRLHEEGIFGKGVKIGIVDTGLDYRHPALGGCFGEGCKVAGGYDFVGDDTWWPFPGEEKIPDEDPMDIQGHGTHVAGIIGGKGDQFTGVAPEATLYSYKVFGSGGTDEETIIEAFLKAYEDGMDIVSASVGSAGGWAESAWAEVSRRLVDEGIVVVIAAGNDGDLGPWSMSSGAAANDALAVASIDASMGSGRRWAATFNLDGHSNRSILAYKPDFNMISSDTVGVPIVPMNLDPNVVNDTCTPLPEDLDLSGVIPLIKLGGCTDMTKEFHVNRRGAKNVLMYMQDGRIDSFSGSGWANSSKAMITNDAGRAIINTILAGGNVTADFSLDPNTNYVGIWNSLGGKPSQFTSWGPTFDLAIKPDIAAPGGRILSTYMDGEYREFSGTSMATPYISGIAALYIGKYGGRSVHGRGFAHMLQTRIMNTGKTVEYTDSTGKDFGFWAPPVQVGTGLVDAFAVLNYKTSLSFAKFHLNDTHHFSRYHSVEITNNDSKDVEYRFTVQDAAGFETQFTDASEAEFAPRIKDLDELVPIKITPSVSLPGGRVVVKPGETRRVQFNFKQPQGLNAPRLPIYSGKILLSGNNGDELSVPYFGLAADLKRDVPDMWFTQNNYPRIVSGPANTPLVNHSSFTFNLSATAQDFPKLQTIFRYGSREYRWDIFEASYREREWVYPPVPGQNKFVGAATSFDYQSSPNFPIVDPETDDLNMIWSFPMYNLPRDVAIQAWWLGKLADGTQIKPGKYVFRVAALAPFGNPRASDNWHVWLTQQFEVVEE
ncbi:minor extracellular protease vpr [Stachybotrys elegans]|uniref:Minor extracellular protease vpr n=1 Tax=Stachybotrys elegans TaxID=80388 RepID=A0A8K0SBU0_9HYPO|nr:minor extracellular protease vpr [Stachybotrys elegans]